MLVVPSQDHSKGNQISKACSLKNSKAAPVSFCQPAHALTAPVKSKNWIVVQDSFRGPCLLPAPHASKRYHQIIIHSPWQISGVGCPRPLPKSIASWVKQSAFRSPFLSANLKQEPMAISG